MDTKSKKFKAVAGFICFFLSISMLLAILPSAFYFLSDFKSQRDRINSAFKDDYQSTDEFKDEISRRLTEAITMATGGPINGYYYDDYGDGYHYGREASSVTDLIEEGRTIFGSSWTNSLSPTEEGYIDDEMTEEEKNEFKAEHEKYIAELHESYKKDKNLLYTISYDGKVKYTNADKSKLDWTAKTMPDGYNFLFYFDGKKATALKDGQEVDIYGDGIYHDGDEWYIPGYSNFTTDEESSKVTVCFAAEKNPLLYVEGNYSKQGVSNRHSSLYWITQNLESQRNSFKTDMLMFVLMIVFFIGYILLRKGKAQADKAIARLTGKVWFEVKLLVLIVPMLTVFFITLYQSGIWSMIVNWQFYYYTLYEVMQETGYILQSATPIIILLFWVLYLFINDIRYNKQTWKQSICGKLSARELKLPIQKRMAHRTWAILAAVVIWAIPSVLLWSYCVIDSNIGKEFSILVLIYLLSLFGVIALILKMYENNNAITDLSRLTDQIEAVRNGNLTTHLELPNDAELLHAAQSLNDIQHGMKISLDNQMKSERMKVELVSNVSHDIKTPLTSIVSYVDLLKQEENLPDYIKDYVTVLDEKSKRLKDMVQDVFEVSKAASGQLPIKLENLDFCKLLRQTIADMSEEIESSSVTLKTEIPEEAITINADGGRLYRVFQNLIQNSLKYSLDGSRVFVLLKAERGKVTATIQNTSKFEIQNNVDFTERFVRGDQSRTDGGSGLGLSIASSFTEACGGRFTVENIADLFIAKVEFNEIP